MTRNFVFLTVALSLLCSCGSGNVSSSPEGEEIPLEYSRWLRMEDMGGATLVTITNPWDSTHNLARYLLMERDDTTARDIDAVKVRVPMESSVVFSAVHVSLIDELGGVGAIKGICDSEYIYTPEIRKGLDEGRVTDCGSSSQPNVEKILSLAPGGVLLSPYEDSMRGNISPSTGIPVILAADYLEPTPLGRAEWMRFYGRLYGKGEAADSLFSETEREYLALSEKAKGMGKRPKVLFDKIYGSVWNLPTSGSVTGRLIEDAGGENIFADGSDGVVASLAPERVIVKGGEADIWFLRYNSGSPLTLQELSKENPLYSRIKAFKEGNVWGSNTSLSGIFEDAAFHPHLILGDMIRVLHPEMSEDITAKRYYERLSR